MEESKRDSTLSKASTGSVETPGLMREDSNDDTGNRYTLDYASTEALLQEQIGHVTKNRLKIKRLKKNLCILIVFLVDILLSFRDFIMIVKVICLLGAVGYSVFLHWELWKMQKLHTTTNGTTTPSPKPPTNESRFETF